MEKFKRVLITGGTHGNELTGVYLVKKIQQQLRRFQRKTLSVSAIHANLKAIEQVRRYVDQDLNRSFNFKSIVNLKNLNYEQKRALELSEAFGEHSQEPVDVILDLHSTVSKNGVSIFPLNIDAVSCAILQAAQQRIDFPLRFVLCTASSMDSHSFLSSMSTYSFGIEVGPVPMGALDASAFMITERLVQLFLDLLDEVNTNKLPPYQGDITFYDMTEVVYFPKNEQGDIQAMVHPDLLPRNFELLKTGDPLFQDFEGNVIYFEGKDCYPMFINEGAYYDKGVAMCLTQKITQRF